MAFPVDMSLHSASRRFDIEFDDGRAFDFSYEFLRVNSPSAEVQGHSPDQAKLQVGKREVTIQAVEPVGQYALRFKFSDGHDSGIYSFDYLYDLGEHKAEVWDAYLKDLEAHGASRDPDDPNNEPFKDKPKSKCPSHH